MKYFGGPVISNVNVVVVFWGSSFDESNTVLDCVRAGARGFMLKDASFEQLIGAIRAIAGGATVFQPAITERLLQAARQRPFAPNSLPEALTEREL